jgi:hypothetical protein
MVTDANFDLGFHIWKYPLATFEKYSRRTPLLLVHTVPRPRSRLDELLADGKTAA